MKIGTIVAQEEQTYGAADTAVDFEYAVAVEEAELALVATEEVANVMDEADSISESLTTQIAVEEALLTEPDQITAATATLALGTASMYGESTGFEVAVGVEDSVVDPVRSFTVGLEEKRNILKKIYDSAVIMLTKLVNMAKKAFAKIIMTLNGNEGALKKLTKEVEKVTEGKLIVKGNQAETIGEKFPTYMVGSKNLDEGITGLTKTISDSKKAAEAVFASIVKTTTGKSPSAINKTFADFFGTKFLDFGTILEGFVKSAKTRMLFGESIVGEYKYKCVSVNPTSSRYIVSSADEKADFYVALKTIKASELDDTVPNADDEVTKTNLVELLTAATSKNKSMKSDTDTNFKHANNSLDNVIKLAKKGDTNDEAETVMVKTGIAIEKINGNLAFKLSMDTYKNIRVAISLTNAILSEHKDNKKEKK